MKVVHLRGVFRVVFVISDALTRRRFGLQALRRLKKS